MHLTAVLTLHPNHRIDMNGELNPLIFRRDFRSCGLESNAFVGLALILRGGLHSVYDHFSRVFWRHYRLRIEMNSGARDF